MQYYKCKCGYHEAWGSMGVRPCDWCDKCGTTLAGGPSGHKTERTPHKMKKFSKNTETDEGIVETTITRCIWCMSSKIKLDGQPMTLEE